MPIPKPVLMNTYLSVYPTDAEGTVVYFLDLEGTGYSASPDVLNQALNYLPRIGSQKDFSGVVGAPRADTSFGNPYSVAIHNLRVWGYRSRSPDNPAKVWIDVIYKSKPQPTIEFGSSGTQESTNTYLHTARFDRAQMLLGWTIPANAYSPGFPAKDLGPLPLTPFTSTRFSFGSTVRVSSTFYSDELNQTQMLLLGGTYTTTINRDPLFYTNSDSDLLTDDNRLWLCSAINQVSNDGGYSTRVSVEWVFNPVGWDSIGVYEYQNAPAILSQSVVDGIFTNLPNDPVPVPYLPKNGGAGRWPQQYAIPMTGLLGWASQGILAPPATIVDVLAAR